MAKITNIRARQLIDCKRRPVVEVDVETDQGIVGRGSAPTGSSVGAHEAFVLRDGDKSKFDGLGVKKAVENVQKVIGPALVGMDVEDLRSIDNRMIALDGTENKRSLGSNAIYSVSVACLRAAAETNRVPAYKYLCGKEIRTVPVPSFNVVNGGRQGGLIQPVNEFHIVPYKAADVEEAAEIGCMCFNMLEKVISKYSKEPPRIGTSFGWVAPSEDPEKVFEIIADAVNRCGYADKVAYAMDWAAVEMYDAASKTYLLHGERVSAFDMIAYAKKLSEKFPLVFIEDLLDEDDWDNYPKANASLSRTLLIGDDFIVSNLSRIRRAHETKAVDGFILKPNQVGTVSEALDTHAFAREHGLYSVPSGRAGGVVGDIITDFSVGLEVPFVKSGAPRSGERLERLNFLIRACDLTPGCGMADLSSIVRF